MTTATLEAKTSVGYRMDQAAIAGEFVRLAPDVDFAPQDNVSVRMRNMDPRNSRTITSDVTKKVLRRMQGFLIETTGEEAKVMFVDGKNSYEYYLPAKHLQSAVHYEPLQNAV